MIKTLVIAQSKTLMEEPHDCTDAKDVLNVLGAFFDPLVAYDEHMNYVPGLAKSWSVSNDARTWTFTLREGVRFHNGQRMEAEAVAYSLSRMARPDMGVTLGAPGVYNQYLAGMELNVIDNLTVGITLNEPMADLLDVLVTGYILPPDEVEKRGSDFAKAPVGTGPYRFAGYEEGIVIKAARNNDYWGIPPVYDAVEWVMVPDPSQRLLMLANGEADIAAGPPFTTGIESPVNCVSARGTTAYILIFNTTCEKLTDPRVRRAINLGVDRVALIDKVLNGAGYPLDGFISPVHFGYDPDSTGFPYDPDQAQSLLADAGFGGGLKLTLDSPTSLPNEAVLLSNSLAEQLSEIDIELDIVYTEDRLEYANKVRLKDIHDLCVFDSSPLSTYRVLKEKVDSRFAGSWWQGYSNAEIEKLLDEAQVTVNYESREALYRKCYRLLNNDPPWLYLYNYQNLICTSSALIGLQPPVHNIIDLRYV